MPSRIANSACGMRSFRRCALPAGIMTSSEPWMISTGQLIWLSRSYVSCFAAARTWRMYDSLGSACGEARHRVLLRRLVAAPAATAVEDDELEVLAVGLDQIRDLEDVSAQPADPEQRLSRAMDFVVEADSVDLDVWHESRVASAADSR